MHGQGPCCDEAANHQFPTAAARFGRAASLVAEHGGSTHTPCESFGLQECARGEHHLSCTLVLQPPGPAGI